MVRMDHDPGPVGRESLAIDSAVVDHGGLAASVDGPADDPTAVDVEDHAAVDLSFPRRVLCDVGEPQDVGSVDGEVALDQVLFCGLVDQVLPVLLRSRKALDPQFSHDGQDQLLVDHHALLALDAARIRSIPYVPRDLACTSATRSMSKSRRISRSLGRWYLCS